MKIEKNNERANSGLKKRKKVALGRGLEALIPDIEFFKNGPVTEYFLCDIEMIHSNRYQPRTLFTEDELEELSQSIKEQGIIQPLLIRKDDDGYELVAGERRLRAAKMAGLTQVPVIVKSVTDADLLEMSIIENIQRQDLNPLDESEAYHRLLIEFNHTQDQVAKRIGKSRSAVANILRLRQLPEQIKATIMDGTLSMGHARALLGAESKAQQNAIWKTVVSKKLSVRETEALVNRLKAKEKSSKGSTKNPEQIYFADLADNLSRYFGTKVQIKRHGQKGKVEIEFYNNDDLDRLIGLLKQI